MKKSTGIIQIAPLIVVAILVAGLVSVTTETGKVTNFFNKAYEENFGERGRDGTPDPIYQDSLDAWQKCVSTSGSKILQTYPSICVSPDGKRVTEPSSASPRPDPESSSTPSVSPTPLPATPRPVSWSECIVADGSVILQTYPQVCVYTDGSKVSEPIVIQSSSPTPSLTPSPFPPTTPPPYYLSTSTPSNTSRVFTRSGPIPTTVTEDKPVKDKGSWTECFNTPGAIVLQTYPSICRYPDGRQVTEQTPLPTPRLASPTSTPVQYCGGIRGLGCPTESVCIYSDGTSRAPYPDASGTCQRSSTVVGSWTECISTRGSRILQTYPGVCIYLDGRKVGQPISPTTNRVNTRTSGTAVNSLVNTFNRIISAPRNIVQRLLNRR